MVSSSATPGEHTRYNLPSWRLTIVTGGVVRVRASNPSVLTLDGTNTYVVGRWVVDPGPADADHLEAVRRAARHGIEGVVLTHSHADHAEGADRLGVPVTLPSGGEEVGPFRVLATPGHSADSVCLISGGLCFTGDTVLGSGSVFIVGPAKGRCPRTSTPCAGCASSISRFSVPATARTSGNRTRSSASI